MIHLNKKMKFLYSSLGYLVSSTLIRAIYPRYLNSLPDLTAHNMSKLDLSDFTILGYLNNKRKNI